MHFTHKVQSFLVMISSRVVEMLHVVPCRALVGQTYIEIPKLPDCGSFVSSLVVTNGAVVRSLPSVTSQQYRSVNRRLFFAINPNLDRGATVSRDRRPLLSFAMLLNPSASSI